MHKKTLNIVAVCIVALIIVFSITHKAKVNLFNSDNITVDASGKILTKADQYQANIIDTVSEENIKNFKKFAKTFDKTDGDNLTDSFSKDIFSQYIKYNTSGTMKDDEVLSAANDILQNKTTLQNPTVYKDIKVVTSNLTNLKTYGNNLAVIQNGINSGILSINKKSDKTYALSAIYAAAAKLFIQVEVPESLADSHLEMINGFRKYSEGLIMMAEQNKDPARALIGLTKTKDATAEIVDGFDNIKKTIILNKITYAESEPGYSLMTSDENNTTIMTQ